ncbi:diacylglycerol kinase family protein [Carnobacterium sp.]|uniref:diacylglycerol/lipid kinase family protein n=1 Tax=Carnobacterium sp. TaxID=48221 RepID=UPI002FC9778C
MKKIIYHFIVNEHSGSGNGLKIWQKILPIMEKKEISYQKYTSTFAGETIELVEKIAKKINIDERLVVIGGDGTLHEAIQGLGETYQNLPIGYIPAGSGNDFARGVGISRKPLKALEQLLNAETFRSIDVIEFSEENTGKTGYFVNNIGLGFDALIVKLTNHSTSKAWLNKYNLGSLAYLSSLIKAYFHQPNFPIVIDVDGQSHYLDKAFLVTTTNHSFFGGGVNIAPMAKPTNGLIDVIIVSKIPIIKIAFLFVLMMLGGRHTRFKSVLHFNGKDIRIETKMPENGQADGEELGSQLFNLHFTPTSRYFWF